VRLHCTPVINLFERATSPIELKTRSDRLPLVVDSEFPKAFEIHAVNQVRRSSLYARILQPTAFVWSAGALVKGEMQ